MEDHSPSLDVSDQVFEHEHSPLLSLPPHIRYEIYSALGVVVAGTPRFVDLNNDPRLGSSGAEMDDVVARFYKLLLTCRFLSEEVCAYVYSKNHFFIRYNELMNLSALRMLRPQLIRSMRLLTIHLNSSSCELGLHCERCLNPEERPLEDKDDALLSLQDPLTRNVLFEWQRTWRGHMQPSLIGNPHLHFSFICDVQDLATAREVVRPFFGEKQALLSSCSIRLSSTRDAKLTSLARRAVAALTGDQAESQAVSGTGTTFDFFGLPHELQDHILTYTDLVTPFKEIEWAFSRGMYVRYPTRYSLEGRDSGHMHGGEGVSDLASKDPENSYTPCWRYSAPAGCFCQAFHSAYSNVHACKCWAPPTAIFLVSHSTRELATDIFFRHNRFVIAPVHSIFQRPTRSQPERLPASIFLSDVVPRSGLRSLRDIEIVLSPSPRRLQSCQALSESAGRDWVDTITKMKDFIDLPKLTISVHLATGIMSEETFQASESTTEHGVREHPMGAQYSTIVEPLAMLSGLGRFFARLAGSRQLSRNPTLYHKMKEMEELWEANVMGSGYDAQEFGKEKQRWSRWYAEELA